MAGGLFVPQLVTPIDPSAALGRIGQTLGGLREDSDIAGIMKGIDPYDPNSTKRVISDLYSHGSRTARDMADRLSGLQVQRDTVDLNKQKFEQAKKFGNISEWERQQLEGEQAREDKGIEAASRLTGRPIPTESGAVPGPQPQSPGAPRADVAPAPQRVGGPVMPTSRVWGDKEAEDAGLYEKSTPTTAPVSGAAPPVGPGGPVRAGGPLTLQPLPPPPPRNVAGTGVAPGPTAAGAGQVPAAPAAQPVAGALPSAPAPLRPQAGPQVAQAAPTGIADLVSERPAAIQRPAPTRTEGQILDELSQLSALENSKYPKNKEGIKSAIRMRENELKVIRERQDKGYQAQLDEAKGSGSKRYEHALKAADEVHKQDMQDNQTSFALARAYKTLENGLNTGTLSDTMTWGAKVGDTAGKILEVIPGVDANRIPLVKNARNRQAAMEEFNGLAGKALMDIVGSFGKVTEKEGDKVQTMIFGMDKSITGNVKLVKFANDLINTRRAAAQDVRNYMRQMGNDADPAHVAEIKTRHFRGALARMEAEIDADPWGLKIRPPKEGAAPTREAPATTGGGAAVSGPAARGGPPITRQQYDQLPSGATYTAPDGTTRTKGGI